MLIRDTEADADTTIPTRTLHEIPERGIVLRVLGDVEVAGARGTFAPGRARPGALLALLTIHAGQVVPVERLIDELWTTQACARDIKRVQVNVLRLRRALGRIAPDVDPAALVRTRGGGYALELDAQDVDATRFVRLVARGRRELDGGDLSRAAATLRSALGMWRGEPYADYAYEPFVAAEVRRLEELHACATETWVEAQLALGAHAAMAAELERLVVRHPLRERLHGLLMLALYRCGRQGDALAAYRSARAELVDTLGIEPGTQLRKLHGAILEQSALLDLDGGDRLVAQVA